MIGKTLQDILESKNINVNELSRRTGISNQTIYSIIKRDNMKVDFEVLLKICAALDVDIECFYSDYVTCKKNNSISLTSHEKELLLAYRAKPEMQASIDKLLDISPASDSVADDIVNTINSASPISSPISKK
jgi:DNA-binding Xre family transcriptional regulator